MKKTLHVLFVLLGLTSLYSCSKVVYTHQQVLQSFRTKSDVTKQFGVPDEKITGEGMEMWTYKSDTLKGVQAVNKRDTLKDFHTATDSLKANQYNPHDKYIKFIFDTAGDVTGYKSYGVNLSRTKKDNFGKGLLNVLGVTAVIIVIVGVTIAKDGNFDF
jgi:hypothetical protein